MYTGAFNFRIPLVPRRPKSGDVSGTAKEVKAKKSTPRRDKSNVSEEKVESPTPPSDPDEKVTYFHICEYSANLHLFGKKQS